MNSRRGFMKLLAALPFCGGLARAKAADDTVPLMVWQHGALGQYTFCLGLAEVRVSRAKFDELMREKEYVDRVMEEILADLAEEKQRAAQQRMLDQLSDGIDQLSAKLKDYASD